MTYFVWILASLIVLVPRWVAEHFLGRHPHPPSYTLFESIASRCLHRFVLLASETAFFFEVVHSGHEPSESIPEEANKRGKFKQSRVQWLTSPAEVDKRFVGPAIKAGCEPWRIAGVVWGKPGSGPPREDLVVEPNETFFLHIYGGGLMMGNATEHYFINRLADRISECEAIDHILSLDYSSSTRARGRSPCRLQHRLRLPRPRTPSLAEPHRGRR